MQRIRAAVCHRFGTPLSIEELDLRPPGSGEIEVALTAVAICHSDISFADGAWGGALPAVYGHEAAGHVSSLGPESPAGLSIGDAVAVTLIRACGHCASCASGKPTSCGNTARRAPALTLAADGRMVEQVMNCAAFAERVVVDASQVVKLPDRLDPAAACLLSCGVITGVGAVVNAARLRPGEDVVVIGAGGVGLNAIQGALIAGARRIVAIDLLPAKLEDARAFGATDTVLASIAEPWREVKRVTGRLADIVVVSVGAISAFQTATRYLAPGGRAIAVGMPESGAEMTLEPVVLAALGQQLIGSRMGDAVIQRDIPWLVDLWQQGRIKLDELVSRRWRLEEINEAIADTRAGAARRNVIVFD